jgi:glycosyltransferase involved in cell wall biosynthesis
MEFTKSGEKLFVILPVFNEQASVCIAVTEWFYEIEKWTEDFVFLVLNDGSTDDSLVLLEKLRDQLGSRLEIVSHANRGHGQTCVVGYRNALDRGAKWIFQIDSDGQCDPKYFSLFWQSREKFDVIYGVRRTREDGWRRMIVSQVLRLVLVLTCHVDCVDANVPYRLMRAEVLKDPLSRIPDDFFLANVAIAVLLQKNPCTREGKVPIRFLERYGGEPKIALSQFGSKARQLILQLRLLLAK